ncbi:hypothetical protein ANCCAN_25890 [Ancylostoma caninum]|uniref:Uncharacterized protein n=1 Tax=Ancylostoma caninum TaxID=29170 RepID=A0A368FDU9_ANCCA|nr:hypothetical protein ANCCAN_25890 [Ancylostoma caninum]
MRAGIVLSLSWLISAYVHYVDGSQFAGDAEIHDKGHIKQHLEDKIEIGEMTEEQQR